MNRRVSFPLSIACGGAVVLALLDGRFRPVEDPELLTFISSAETTPPSTEPHKFIERFSAGSPAAQRMRPMQDALANMSEMHRNQLFRLAIRDGGFRCDDVRGNSAIGHEYRMWRVSCENAHRYLVVIGDLEQLVVTSIAVDDAVY